MLHSMNLQYFTVWHFLLKVNLVNEYLIKIEYSNSFELGLELVPAV